MLQKSLIILALLLCSPPSSSAQKTQHPYLMNEILSVDSSYLNQNVFVSSKYNLPKQFAVIRELSKSSYIANIQSFPMDSNIENIKIHEVSDLWKLSSTLQEKYEHFSEGSSIKLIIKYSSTLYLDPQKVEILRFHPDNIMEIKTSGKYLFNHILPHKNILYIERLPQALPLEESLLKDTDLTLSGIKKLKATRPELDGSGINVSIKEGRYDEYDLDLLGRHITNELEADFITNHATDMATILAGSGTTSPNSIGLVNLAKISSSSFENIFPDQAEYFSIQNIFIQNHSYGSSVENFYSSIAQSYDQQTYLNPNLLHIFSVGNDLNEEKLGTYKDIVGFGDLTGSYKMAKNILTVTGVDAQGNPIKANAAGPAYDGRLKPEICAYSISGSSNAAATISGSAAILYQIYFNKFNEIPEAALIKCILMNTADDIGPQGIDYLTGYGLLNIIEAVSCLEGDKFIVDQVESTQTIDHQIVVPNNAFDVKIMLHWTDPAGEVDFPIALVNDLDLVVSHNGKLYFPSILNSTPNLDSLSALSKIGIDHINVTEQIVIPTIESNEIQISIRADKLSNPQKYSVSYSYKLKNTFDWIYPIYNQTMPNLDRETGTFRWKSTYPNQSTNLEISYDGGNSWDLIVEDLQLDSEFFFWKIDLPDGIAQVRLSMKNTHSVSDSFVISRPIIPKVLFDCQDDFLISWQTKPDAMGYNFYKFNGEELILYKKTVDTFLHIIKADIAASSYAIEAQFPNGLKGPRSILTNLFDQNGVCYIEHLFAEVDPNGLSINLDLQLSTTVNIKNIDLYKINGSEIISLAPNNTTINKTNMFIDNNPIPGINRYEAFVTLNNENTIGPFESDINYIFPTDHVIFPNPLTQYDEIIIATNPSALNRNLEISIYNSNGKIIHEQPLNFEYESIIWFDRNPGIYFYEILGNNIEFKGKIFVL